MEKFITVIGAALVFSGTMAALLPITTLFGAIAGWIVGLFFGDTILYALSEMGLRNITMWQLGATLGFVSTFLRTRVESNAK